jgi:hypothetical protein
MTNRLMMEISDTLKTAFCFEIFIPIIAIIGTFRSSSNNISPGEYFIQMVEKERNNQMILTEYM